MTYEISPSMGEPYTVTALIVITLGGFGSMAGRLVGRAAAGRGRGGGHALHEPVAQDAAVVRGVHRRAALAAQRAVLAMNGSRSSTGPGCGCRIGLALAAVPALGASEFVRVAGAHLPDVRRAGIELEPVLRHHALPVARHLGLLRHRRLCQRAAARPAALAGRDRARRGCRGGRRGGDGRAVLHLRGTYFAVLDLRHDRADPPRRHHRREAGHRHRGPRARRWCRSATRCTSRCSRSPLRRSSSSIAVRRSRFGLALAGIGADEQRAQTLGVNTRLREDRRLRAHRRLRRRGGRGDERALDLHRPGRGVQPLHRLPDRADRADRRRGHASAGRSSPRWCSACSPRRCGCRCPTAT